MAQILIAEDDAALRDTLRMALEDEGHTIAQASDGAAALYAIRCSPTPLVVLLDSLMPRMNADDVLQAVVADHDLACRHAFIVFSATGRSLSLKTANIIEQLRIPIIRRPFDLLHLLVQVEFAAQRLAQTNA